MQREPLRRRQSPSLDPADRRFHDSWTPALSSRVGNAAQGRKFLGGTAALRLRGGDVDNTQQALWPPFLRQLSVQLALHPRLDDLGAEAAALGRGYLRASAFVPDKFHVPVDGSPADAQPSVSAGERAIFGGVRR